MIVEAINFAYYVIAASFADNYDKYLQNNLFYDIL